MTDEIDSLLIDVRARTEGFQRDIATMRSNIDGDLVSGFTRAGDALEKGLAGALRSGAQGFGELKRVATETLAQIAAQSIDGLFSGSAAGTSGTASSSGLSGLFSGLISGLPGRATGGNVAPGRSYMVGERGPELFVPTSAGRIETGDARSSREVKVAINLNVPRGASTPQSLQRSSRQMASAVRRALAGR